jgi:hypothetical protein
MSEVIPISSRGVTRFSLSHRMGEGQGEGALFFSGCRPHDFRLLTSPCPSPKPEDCGRTLPGRKSVFGNCSVRGGWPVTNFAVNSAKRPTISTFTVWRRDLRSSWTASVMEPRGKRNMTREEMLSSQPEGFSSKEFGTINFSAQKGVKTSWKTFGRYCRAGVHIRKTLRRLRFGASRTKRPGNPHPDPLPSDGRGDNHHAQGLDSIVGCLVRLAEGVA